MSIKKTVREAKAWVKQTNGVFSEEQFSKSCGLVYDPVTCRQLIADLLLDGTLEAYGNRHGQYVKVDSAPTPIDWQGATLDEYPIWMPLNLSQRVVISPGNIIVVAGEKNSGKTSFGRRIAYDNLRCNGGQHDTIKVLDYESHESEIARMNNSIDQRHESWHGFDIQRVSRNYHNWIDPNGFNIIDYLKVNEDFSLVGRMVGAIHEKLENGIAIVFLQKKRGEHFGRGGEFSLEEPRLGVSLFANGPCKWARATKVKVPRDCVNIEDMEIDYDLNRGAHFVEKTDWRYVNKKSREKIVEDEMFAATSEMYRHGNQNSVF